MSEATLTNGPIAPPPAVVNVNLPQASSLLPNQNPTLTQVGPTPPISSQQRSELEQYMRRDAMFLPAFEQQRQMQIALMNEKQLEIRQAQQTGTEIFGPGYNPAYGNGSSAATHNPAVGGPSGSNAFHIVYPAHRKRARKSKEFTFTKAMIEEQAQKEDTLVPIRLEVEVDGLVLRDTFTWNLHETLITPEHFAEVLCEDMQFPALQFAPQIAKSIREQIQDYHLPVLSSNPAASEDQEQPAGEDTRPSQELRILIKIDITVANTSLVDQFEWDISCPNNDPEHFAEVLANELGLGGEFRTAIAHSIREQVQIHTKCLNLIGYSYDGGSVHDEDLRSSFLPKITTILREEEAVEQFTPILEKLTEPEIDKLERDRERDKRRKRRQTRGRRGVILPDREPSKTKRTLLHHGYTLEPTDPLVDAQQHQHDPAQSNRLGPATRRTTMAHDHPAQSSVAAPAPSLAGQATPSHHRMTRKLRGSGSDLSVHHLGVPSTGNGPAVHTREGMYGSRERLTAGGREHHAYSPMRETTPAQSNRDGE
ncbi:SWI/SNF chromatin-remodeling complex subunit [Linnemannia schmuckeri]|uniref:SWI/SNF chromatin-remodeling complex subunit n=1 Tax=Linnemannia schmuckeri TaxID=64567 RepID=A0A9P5RYS7_9FUNG|nr:SWI/SNF chromatin-remodeling complex subunit [Linnemannia schmuckeri]